MTFLEELKRITEEARAELTRVCADNFRMRIHIPVQPDDSDEIIGRALDLIPKLIAVVEAAKTARDTLLPRLLHGDEAHRAWLIEEVERNYAVFDREMKELESP